ncbi:hypothetical protein BV22DRAFT_412735 [Leucogyrophana mollusca]|uniref:Uncharacterized protein n=1 Tax=Leucogyrophana mollusca TaxID=85980 RepID=A0ACB8BIU4_9AGAM|nr:hypothetical protein BV22DRAFT_412735 [Leucogyrophana mollusca]
MLISLDSPDTMDDEVQYLGTKLAPIVPSPGPCNPQQQVSGITLHVDKCGERPAHDITFHRSRTSFVNIGRKSASDDRSMRKENDDHNAVFACQVVSGKHAKLVLSDSGQVYVVDLKSRHGTHILKQGETASKALQPEVETPLADGDVLTFGKTVGSGSFLVAPVTVRIELLRETHAEAISSPSPLPYTPPLSPLGLSRSRRSSSGRYGLFIPSPYPVSGSSSSSSSSDSFSSDAGPSQSEHDSDVEEIPPWANALRHRDGLRGVKIPGIRSIIQDVFSKMSQPPNLSPDSDSSVTPAAPLVDEDTEEGPSVQTPSEPSHPSRSHSPMELSTPSPAPSLGHPCESGVVGTWPDTRSASPEVQIITPAPKSHQEFRFNDLDLSLFCDGAAEDDIEDLHPSVQAMIESMSGNPIRESVPAQCILEPMLPPPPAPECAPSPAPIPAPATAPAPAPAPALPRTSVHSSESHAVDMNKLALIGLRASVHAFEQQVGGLRRSVDTLTGEFRETEDDVIEMQGQIQTLEVESVRSIRRLDAAERRLSALADLQGQVNTLQTQVDAPEKQNGTESLGEIKACADALDALVAEMRILREETEKRLTSKFEEIRAARSEALSTIAAEVEVRNFWNNEIPANTFQTFNSLKRKRSEVEESDGSAVPAAGPPAPATPAICDLQVPEAEQARPQKRARKVFNTIAHTATAVAVGAVATWTALAFS